MIKLQITYRNPADLKFYANNARTHSDVQIDEIIVSIQDYGFNDPVDIDETDTSIAGEGRIRAALRMGLKEIPTISLAHLSERQKKGYILAHNRIALNSGWDLEKLSTELDALVNLDVDITGLGFDEQELDALLKQNHSILPEGSLPEEEPTKTEKRSRSKSKILHKCPNCNHEFTA
jgi:ParB family transcriptional regulator, chromosome partitioning protein